MRESVDEEQRDDDRQAEAEQPPTGKRAPAVVAVRPSAGDGVPAEHGSTLAAAEVAADLPCAAEPELRSASRAERKAAATELDSGSRARAPSPPAKEAQAVAQAGSQAVYSSLVEATSIDAMRGRAGSSGGPG